MTLATFKPRAEPTGQGDKAIRDDLVGIVLDYEASAARTMQKAIGLSEIGHACTRRIAYKISGWPEPEGSGGDPWYAIMGTAVHAWLAAATAFRNAQLGWQRYLIEEKVALRSGLGGHSDVYDCERFTVIDHKIVGATNLKKYRIHGPPPDYRVQGHSYCQGWVNKGYRVDKAAIAFYPRSDELARGLYVWSEDFDPSVVTAAVRRLDVISELVRKLNPVADPIQFTKFPRVPERNCMYCPFIKPGKDVGALCPGNT